MNIFGKVGTWVKLFFIDSFFSRFLPALGSLSFVIYLVYIGWMALGPQKPEADSARRKAADTAVKKIVEDIRSNRGDVSRVIMLHFYNDPTDYFSNSLRDSINRTGVLNLDDSYFSEKFRNMVNMRNQGTASCEEALKAVEGENVQAVLWGNLERFESSGRKARLIGNWQLVDIKSKQVVCEGKINEDDITPKANALLGLFNGQDAENALPEESSKGIPLYVRILVFVLIGLLLPVLTFSFLRNMVVKRSNRLNAFLLGLYTVCDAILAFLMIGAAFTSGWMIVLFTLAVALAFLYNMMMMSFALKLES